MSIAAVWEFIVGDSKFAPIAVALALGIAFVLVKSSVPSDIVAATFAAIIALGLAAAVFERT